MDPILPTTHAVPEPAPAPTPAFMFFTDFDGTITCSDSCHELVDVHGCGREERMRGDADIVAGRRTFRAVWGDLLGSAARNLGVGACCDHVRQVVKLNPAFGRFYEWCRGNGVGVLVVSGGVRQVIESLLVSLLGEEAAGSLRVVSNWAGLVEGKTSVDEPGGWEMTWMDDSPFGHDKSVEIRKYSTLPKDQRPVAFYAGDGISDFSAARETDLLFAKEAFPLVAYCNEKKIPHIPFGDFSIILQVVREVMSGSITTQEALKKYGRTFE